MTNPYTQPTISGYNSSPPPDDGSTGALNEIKWATHKTKLSDPVKNYADAINSNITLAFAKTFLNTVTAISSNYTVQTSDRGKLISATNTITISLLPVGSATDGFSTIIKNNGSGVVTVDADSTETINSNLTVTLNPGEVIILVTDGTEWLGTDALLGKDQLQKTAYISAAGGGTVDAITATYSPAISLTNGTTVFCRATGANTVTNPTFAPNSLTAKTIVKESNKALNIGDIGGASHEMLLRYNSTNDNWVLLNPLPRRTITPVSTTDSAVATGTTTIPWDDTIPQNTEGDEYISQAITPVSSTSKLVVEITLGLASTTTGSVITAALFQDTTVGALKAKAIHNPNNDQINTIAFTHVMTSATTSSTTFKIRAGASKAGTTTFNGILGARKLGGIMASTITITEILP